MSGRGLFQALPPSEMDGAWAGAGQGCDDDVQWIARGPQLRPRLGSGHGFNGRGGGGVQGERCGNAPPATHTAKGDGARPPTSARAVKERPVTERHGTVESDSLCWTQL